MVITFSVLDILIEFSFLVSSTQDLLLSKKGFSKKPNQNLCPFSAAIQRQKKVSNHAKYCHK